MKYVGSIHTVLRTRTLQNQSALINTYFIELGFVTISALLR